MRSDIETITLEPSRRVIFVGDRKFFLSFPKMTFSIIYRHYDDGDLGFCGLTVKFYEKRYSLALLPNFFNHGAVCLGIVASNKFSTLEDLKKCVLEKFWNSRFSNIGNDYDAIKDFVYYVDYYHRTTPYEYLKLWQKKTKEDATWIPDVGVFIPGSNK
jgi:hypothetical protein